MNLMNPRYQGQLFAAQAMSFGRTVLKLWGLLVLVIAFVFYWLDGFGPLWVNDDPSKQVLTILSLMYGAWTFVLTGFLQRDDSYSVAINDSSTDAVQGNKSMVMYAFAVVVWLAIFVIENIIGEPHIAFLAVCAFIQLLPLFMGDSFKEQAENLMPFLANMVLLLASMYLLAFQ